MSKSSTLLVVGVILAAVVYQILGRIPADALNVAVGVLCGIGASIPVSLGLLIALTRQRQQVDQTEWSDPDPEPVRYAPQPVQRIPHAMPQMQQPQIIVLAPQGQLAQGQFPQGVPMPTQWVNQQYPFMQEHANAIDAREWRIIGEE